MSLKCHPPPKLLSERSRVRIAPGMPKSRQLSPSAFRFDIIIFNGSYSVFEFNDAICVFIIEHKKLCKPNHIDSFYQSIFGNCAVFIKLNGVNNITAFDAVRFFALDIMKVFTDRLLQLGFADLQFAIQAKIC